MRDDKLSLTRGPAVLLTSALLGLALGACGSAHEATGSGSGASDSTATSERFTTTTTSIIPPRQSLRGDGDADNPGDIDGNGDSDSVAVGGPDNDSDSPTRASHNFPDKDDKATFAYGHRAGAANARAISDVVKRYYSAAAADQGSVACSLLPSHLASSVPEDYAQVSAPSYLRGDKTCGAVLTMLFRHFHEQLGEAISVVEVRVAGSAAQVIFSSRKMPASHIMLTHTSGSWKLLEPLGQPLP